MTEQTTTGGVLTPGRTKAVASALAGAVLALAAALAGGGGESPVTITTAPNPAVVARLDALDLRVTAIERRLEEGQQLSAMVEGIRQRLDLLLSGARVRLDDGSPTPSRSHR